MATQTNDKRQTIIDKQQLQDSCTYNATDKCGTCMRDYEATREGMATIRQDGWERCKFWMHDGWAGGYNAGKEDDYDNTREADGTNRENPPNQKNEQVGGRQCVSTAALHCIDRPEEYEKFVTFSYRL